MRFIAKTGLTTTLHGSAVPSSKVKKPRNETHLPIPIAAGQGISAGFFNAVYGRYFSNVYFIFLANNL